MMRDRPLSSVVSEIIDNLQQIVRGEIRLARTEATEELSKFSASAAVLAAGAFGLSLSMLFVLIAAVLALSRVMPDWAAALAVAAFVAAVSAVALVVGLRRLKKPIRLSASVASLKEDASCLKQLTT